MNDWQRIKLLNKSEIKHCMKKIIEKEPFNSKKDMLGSLHHVTITRYMRQFNAENPNADRSYYLNGMKKVNKHNEAILKELYREGFFKYEEHKGSYKYKGKKYSHFIIKIK